MTTPWRLAVDIGGTFTDIVLTDGSRWASGKVLTTHDDPAAAVLSGTKALLAREGVLPRQIVLAVHGTTLATNALIERRGAVTALITTAGHRDALEIGLENRFEQYDVFMQRPPPLVPASRRLVVEERIGASGQVLRRLDDGSIEAVIDAVLELGAQSVAIGLLHAYANPAHEQRIAAALRLRAPGLSVSLSSDVCPEVREYERLSTTCANAFVKPLMARYLRALESGFGSVGFRCPLLVMTSGGGLASVDTACAYPIRLVESGPAGGAMLAAALSRRSGLSRVLAFDMGGTTAKLTLIDDGEPQWSRAFEVARAFRFRKGSGLPVRIPVIELVEIGAGGGSIAQVDRLGRIQVGPESAGSEPGPAGYARGGDRPTVTDADLVLGRMPADRFAGGELQLRSDLASGAIDRHVAAPLGATVLTVAQGISDTVDENMAAAARNHAGEWGRDLAGRTLIAFGGAAPLHAVQLARRLGIDSVVVPAHAGVGSAVGFLLAPVAHEVVRSRYMRVDGIVDKDVNVLFGEMRDEARAVVSPLSGGTVLRETRRAYMRYVGQGHEIAVAVPDAATDLGVELAQAFGQAYRRHYGRTIPGQPIEVLSWTLSLSTASPVMPAQGVLAAAPPPAEPEHVAQFDGRETRQVPVLFRGSLRPASVVEGPALVSEDQTTTVVPAGCRLLVDQWGQLIITIGKG